MARSLVKKTLGRNRGFTILEVAVSMMVLSVGLLSLATVIPLMKSDVQRSETRTRASFLAEETAEWLHSLQYADALLASGQHIDLGFNVQGFARSWVVEDDIPISNVKRVTVSIDADNDRVAESATLVFLYARAGR